MSWDAPASANINGVLIGYDIIVCQSVTMDCRTSPGNIGLQTNVTVPGLNPTSRYIIKLAARTRTGIGVYSNPTIFSPGKYYHIQRILSKK